MIDVSNATSTAALPRGAVEAAHGTRHAARSVASWTSRIVVFGATSIVLGVIWDISWHRTIGRDTFWTPAHLAIYLGGLLGGLVAGALILWTTWRASEGERQRAVRLWGFRGPLGAWVCVWGALAMLTSAPFDNWWHDAYGLDVKILSPPHTVLALGMFAIVIGALLLVLREQNGAPAGAPPPGRYLMLYAGGVILAMVAVFLTEESWPNQQRNHAFYLVSCASYPLYLVALGRASASRWGSTIAAAVYMGLNMLMIWILPLFPGEPKLGPIYNPIDRFVPLAFPMAMIVPAFGLDLLRSALGHGRGWLRDWVFCLAAAVVFTALFVGTQWHFAEFLIGPGGQNAFFGADRHWDYTETLGPNRFRFWSETAPHRNVPATSRTFLLSGLLAFAACRLGLWLGNGMSRVRR
ncbi:MAG: hypothetical protein JNL97_09395 [Verrucomicrobiales bacterium]|nr:hypothetical protein [Verrucomicrobiales bacterium]